MQHFPSVHSSTCSLCDLSMEENVFNLRFKIMREEIVKEKPAILSFDTRSLMAIIISISDSHEVLNRRMSETERFFFKFGKFLKCWIKRFFKNIRQLLVPSLISFQVTNDAVGSQGFLPIIKDALVTLSLNLTLSVILSINVIHEKLFELQTIVYKEQPDQRRTNSLMSIETASEDGYKWRKYGQKYLKGSEFPRSYFKCRYPNCQVKKQFERSKDGQITDVIYKGKHDHPKTQSSCRRMAIDTVLSIQEEKYDRLSSFNKVKDKSSNSHGQTSRHTEPNVSSEPSRDAEKDVDVDGEGAELKRRGDEVGDPKSKRRKRVIDGINVNAFGKTIREPRVVVQTPSQVDVLDDGYRWRKYGQKVVKGNPNPRSYYKCTNPRCPVRKHVERASNDLKAVITTYEGKHNHDVPSARMTSIEKAGPTTDQITPSKGILMREQNHAISLDLSVGISSSVVDRSNEKQQRPDVLEPVQSLSNVTGSGCTGKVIQGTPPVSTFVLGGTNGVRNLLAFTGKKWND